MQVHKGNIDRIERYREIYRVAKFEEHVSMKGLKNDIDYNEKLLLDRLNERRKKEGYNCDYDGNFW